MLKWILFTFLTINIFALEITISGAKENHENYSILHLRDSNNFLCQEIKNEFDITTKIVCAFSKQPSNKIRTLQNDFFKITSQIKKKTFFLIITPFYKEKLYPMIFDLTKDDNIFTTDAKVSSSWMIVGYKKVLPFIKKEKEKDVNINFPFQLSKDKLPFVGSLDMKGNPVYIETIQDASDYIKIKKYFNEKKYERCLELIDEVMQDYPNSLFTSELLYYKIKVYSKLKDYDNVIDTSKIYLREYSSDENVPEILSLTANAYSMIGMNTDADYFFDRLFSEHQDSIYTQWGYIYKGIMLEGSGGNSKALEYYNKALLETKNIKVAATAAYKLAINKFNNQKESEAAKYIMKIIKADPSFFMENYNKSKEMMYSFAADSYYKTAAGMAKSILDNIDINHDDYEKILKDRGIWLSKTSNKQEALDSLNKYLKEYPYGEYEQEVQIAKDSLFFDVSDANFTTKINQYNTLIDTYIDDSIAQRAIYEKAKLLLSKKMYSDILGFKESILALDNDKYSDKNSIITQAAVGVMKNALKQKECQDVVVISSEYNISLSNNWDEGLYSCFMKAANYSQAKTIALKNLKSNNLEKRKRWLYRYIKVDFATGNYTDVIEASKELISLIDKDKKSDYIDVYRILFDTYQRLENKEEMITSMIKITDIFGLSYKDIERYVAVMNIGSQRKDDNLVIKYGSQVMQIQEKSNSHAQSPFVEFTLYQAYINKDNINKALEVIKSLNKVKLNNTDRARQKYILGTIYDKLWRNDDAQKAYQEAIDTDSKSAWGKLALDAKNI